MRATRASPGSLAAGQSSTCRQKIHASQADCGQARMATSGGEAVRGCAGWPWGRGPPAAGR